MSRNTIRGDIIFNGLVRLTASGSVMGSAVSGESQV
jgi:hypothetical protein